jgi:hypothetical protein
MPASLCCFRVGSHGSVNPILRVNAAKRGSLEDFSILAFFKSDFNFHILGSILPVSTPSDDFALAGLIAHNSVMSSG